jgi:hypothetical protein
MMPLMAILGPNTGYEIVAWLCWIPNLLVARGIVQGWFRSRKQPSIFPAIR